MKERIMANAPANISTTAKLITRYVLRLRKLRFFIKTITVMRFSVTIATYNINPTASQLMHSGNENIRKSLSSLRFAAGRNSCLSVERNSLSFTRFFSVFFTFYTNRAGGSKYPIPRLIIFGQIPHIR